MSQRFVETEQARAMFIRFIEAHDLPFTASTSAGGKRSTQQNRLSHLWYAEISEQLGDQTANECKAFCKLTIGVPILRIVDDEFRLVYDEVIRPLPYEHKLKLMMPPVDMPVTSRMKTPQMTEYLDTMQRRFSEQGVVLTDPSVYGLDLRKAA